jgi:hypothetical protein
MSVWSSGRCREVQRGTGVAVHGGSATTSTTAQWRQQAEEEERGCSTGGVAPFIATAGGWVRQSDGGHGPNAVSTDDAVVRIGRLTGGPQRFQIFPIYPKLAQI